MKWKTVLRYELPIVILVIAFSLWLMVPQFIASQNINSPTYFPEARLRYTIANKLKKKALESFTTKEASTLDEKFDVVVHPEQVESNQYLKGIEYLPNIEELHINFWLPYNNQQQYGFFEGKTIDVSNNQKLKKIVFNGVLNQQEPLEPLLTIIKTDNQQIQITDNRKSRNSLLFGR